LKGGLELMDAEFMESVHGSEYLFYSFGKVNFQILYDICRRTFWPFSQNGISI